MSRDKNIFEAVLESDRTYFEAGAERIALPGGTIFYMPGFDNVTAGACAHLLDTRAAEQDPDGWITRLDGGFASIGRDYTRVYLSQTATRVRTALKDRGFVLSRETVFAAVFEDGFYPPATTGFRLRKVNTESDWSEKLAIHVNAQKPADGKSGDPETWAAFERRKFEVGYMQPYLVTRDDRAIATFSIAPTNVTLRIKNVVVDPHFRRLGTASAIVGFSCRLAAEHSLNSIGLLALEGFVGERLYRKLGMKELGHIDEYYVQAIRGTVAILDEH